MSHVKQVKEYGALQPGLPEWCGGGSPGLDLCSLEGKVQNFKFSASDCLLRQGHERVLENIMNES